MISKSSCISLQLLERTMFVDPNSDLNNAVRGTINLNMNKTTAIRSISVVFDGAIESKISLIQCADGYAKKKPVTRQQLVIYPPVDQEHTHRSLVLNAGLTQFGFEMQLPSRLPESIDCQDVKVSYSVTAIVQYQSTSLLRGLRTDMDKQKIRITRAPNANDLFFPDVSHSRVVKYKWLHYQIIVNHKTIALGSDLPITFRFLPQQNGVTVNHIGIQLLERRNITFHTGNSIQAILPSKNNKTSLPMDVLEDDWEGTMTYTIPKNASIVHSTQEYSDFCVTHKLLVSVTITIHEKGGNIIRKMLSFQSNIDLLDPVVGESDTLKLPSYDLPPPFDESNPHYIVFPEYDRKFVDPPAYADIYC